MHVPYSRRQLPPPDCLMYMLPPEVRLRIAHTLEDDVIRSTQRSDGFVRFAEEIESLLRRKYGRVYGPGYEAARTSKLPGLEHFFSCPDELALDFIEFSFHVAPGASAGVVDEIRRPWYSGLRYDIISRSPVITRLARRSSVAGG